MRRSGTGSGGGIGMNKNVSVPVRTGSGSKRVREPAVAQIGGNYGDHTTNAGETGWRPGSIYGDRGMNPVKFGNEMALNTGGKGEGRTLYGKSGLQGQHGATAPGNPPAKNRDTLSEFGPDYRRPRS
jgi:hypothetical protein